MRSILYLLRLSTLQINTIKNSLKHQNTFGYDLQVQFTFKTPLALTCKALIISHMR